MAQSADGLKGQETTVHELFGVTDDRFRAPEFQRHFVWGVEGEDNQVSRFWEDFDRLLEEDGDDLDLAEQPALFLGAVVLQVLDPGPPGTGTLYSIIDGQQRIITLYLTLVAIAEAFQEAGDIDSARYMSSEYLLARSPRFADRPRVEATVGDSGVMAEIMSVLKYPEPKSSWTAQPSDTARLTEAWHKIRSEVHSRCADQDGDGIDREALEALRDQILYRIELVTITLGIRHDPHEVYERLNTRGRLLTELDLVRNAVFYTAGSDQDTTKRVYEHHWLPFESRLGDRQDAFWFPYAMIRVPSTTRAKSYRELVKYWRKSLTNDKQGESEARAIVNDLNEFTDGFRAITGLMTDGTEKFQGDVWKAIQRVQRMDAPTVMYPFLMQLVQYHLAGKVQEDEVVQAIEVVDSFLVRRTFCGIGTTGIHAVFKTLWNQVADGLDSTTKTIMDRHLKFPDDDEFVNGIRELAFYKIKASRRRYILAEYENHFPGDVSYPDPREITADHLLPQSASAEDWGGFTSEERDQVIDTWANLVPLTAKAQVKKGAKNWSEQRDLLVEKQGTVFKSTREVFQLWPSEWSYKTLSERADLLCDWAVQRWPKWE